MKKRNKGKKEKKDFKKILLGFLKHNYIYIIMVLLVVVRIGLGYIMGAWHEVNALYDDGAMMRGLSLERLVNPDEWSLIKHLGFSVFLGISALTKLPFTVTLSLFWVLAAFVSWCVATKLTKNKWVQFSVFAYVLFLPIAFTSWGGLRIYRNAVIAPAIILTFSLAMMLIIDLVKREKFGKTIWIAVATGFSFAFTYFLKEDGIWIKLCMMLILLICAIIIIWRLNDDFKNKADERIKNIKQALIYGLICLIPMGVWLIWDTAYRKVDEYFFGVYEINTRTEGELGRFVYNIYKIDSPNRTAQVWAPYDAIEAAFEASPTLGEYPELLEKIMTTEWRGGDIKKNPISRDFLTWIMRTELVDAGMWTNEKEVSDLFAKVNKELGEAFENGNLKKSEGRIQLLSSVGGYSWDEIMNSDLMNQVLMSLGDSLWFNNYEIGFGEEEVEYGTKGKDWDYTDVNKILHMENDVNVYTGKKREVAKVVGNVVCIIYRVINTVLIVVLPLFVIGEVVGIIKDWKNRKNYIKKNGLELSLALASFVFFGITVAYSFATAWFFIEPAGAYHGTDGFVFYTVGVPALLTLALLPAAIGADIWWERRTNK